MNKRILVVDDDVLLRHSVEYSLQKANFSTSTAGTAEDALSQIRDSQPDLILLDIGLAGELDGLDALRIIQRQVSIPTIFVTARRRELDEVVGLELGADDYITKPFDNDVLLARIRAVLRRGERQSALKSWKSLIVGDLRIEPASREAFLQNNLLTLSPKEFEILLLLAGNVNQVVSVETILNRVWGDAWIGEMQTIYVHVHWLREKIERDPAHPKRLLTVKGVGYKLLPTVE